MFEVGGGPLVAGEQGKIHYDKGITDEDWRATVSVEHWLLSAPSEPVWE